MITIHYTRFEFIPFYKNGSWKRGGNAKTFCRYNNSEVSFEINMFGKSKEEAKEKLMKFLRSNGEVQLFIETKNNNTRPEALNKMEYFQVELENEDPKDTMQYIESKREWDVKNQKYRIPIEQLKKMERTTNLNECKIFWRGQYLLIEHDNIIFYWDSFPYCYLKQAVEFMELEKPAKWKTIDKLISLRMGIRQTEVNGCGYVDTLLVGEKMTLRLYKKFMRFAREQDFQHHGSHTF